MADEDIEARRMSEIADAINTILQNDPAETETASRSKAKPTPANDDGSDDELDAAIAAEIVSETGSVAADPASNSTGEADGTDPQNGAAPAGSPDDPFGSPATLDAGAGADDDTTDNTIDDGDATDTANPQKDSDLSLLSLRMQETLADLQSGNDPSEGTRELLEDMKSLRAQVMADVRQEIENLTDAAQERQAMIQKELRLLEAQSQTVRDAVESHLIKFETVLDELHQQYFKNAKAQRIRVDRYREFLQFLLKEREF
jgi:hypothetical protein